MTVYALIITFLFGILFGVVGIIALCDWLDRLWEKRETKAEEEAVRLVETELGGTILTDE